MATPTSTSLADVLIEAGFEPAVAQRAARMIKQDFPGLAKQSEVDGRFDAVDRELKAIHTRFDDLQGGVNQNESVDQTPTSRQEAIARSFDDTTKAITDNIKAHTEAFDRSLKDIQKNTDRCFQSIDRRLTLITWMVGLTITTHVGMLIAILTELLSH